MSHKKYALSLAGIFLSLPLLTFAQSFASFEGLVEGIGEVIGAAVPVVVGLAVLLFLWGLATYILKQDQVDARVAARQRMVWGVIIIFVMVSLWGLVALLGDLTGVDPENYSEVRLVP